MSLTSGSVQINPFSLEGRPPKKLGLRLVSLEPNFFGRGKLATKISAGFFLDEALRFFNFGLGTKKSKSDKDTESSGMKFIKKNFVPITLETFENAIIEYGEVYTELLYNHFRSIYRGVNTNRRKKRGPQDFERLLSNTHDNYIIKAVSDVRLKSFLVPRLVCDNWASKEGKTEILQFRELYNIFKKDGKSVKELLSRFNQGRNSIESLLENTDFYNRSAQAFAMCTDQWLGSAYTLSYSRQHDAKVLLEFAPGKDSNQVGLTEKIYATLTLLQTELLSVNRIERTSSDFVGLWTDTRLIEENHGKEISKLHIAPFGKKMSKVLQLDKWLKNLEDLEEVIIHFIKFYCEIPLLTTTENAYGPIRSDLLWAILFISYLRLFIIRTKILTLIAAIPFRQIYEGGPMSLSRLNRYEDGIVGLLGVSLWEYFSGKDNPNCFSESARNFLPNISGFEDGWLVPTEPIKASESLKTKATRLNFTDHLRFSSGDYSISSDTKSIANLVTLPLRGGKEKPIGLQRIASVNYSRIPSKKYGESKKKYLDRLNPILASFKSFPPEGYFQVPLEENPPFIDEFFLLPIGNQRQEMKVFNKWGPDSDSALSFGAKLSVQLQIYVAAWLYMKGIQESGLLDRVPKITAEIKFTAANIQYGGKFPPHKTHRDGFGFDWSLDGLGHKLNKPERLVWHWSIQWPKDKKIIASKSDQTYAKYIMGEEQPISEMSQKMRFYLSKVYNSPDIPEKKRVADVKKTLKNILPDYDQTKIKISAIPTDAIIAQSLDYYNRGNNSISSKARYLYREFVRSELATSLRNTEAFLRQKKQPSLDELNNHFISVEKRYEGFPVFPDEHSHLAHHIAHTAIVMSIPAEIVWGTPLYHFRALRAITTCCTESSLPSPFGVHSQSWTEKEPEKIPKPIITTKVWPLPIPRLYFLPHDHHHHWHMQYWKKGLEHSWQRNKILSPNISSHFDLVCACLPFWRFLRVDFKPFVNYLKLYEHSLSPRKENQKKLLDQVLELEYVIDNVIRCTNNNSELRKRIFQKVLSYEEENPISYISKDYTNTQWPPENSLLIKFVEKSEEIISNIKKFHSKIPKDGLPSEIAEALEKEIEEKERILQKANDEITDGELEEADVGYVDSSEHGEVTGDFVARDSQGNPLKPKTD